MPINIFFNIYEENNDGAYYFGAVTFKQMVMQAQSYRQGDEQFLAGVPRNLWKNCINESLFCIA